ncbi:MAG: histidine kinase dimerization/phospho-acceptor domain-containing protein [Bacilli bacterium]
MATKWKNIRTYAFILLLLTFASDTLFGMTGYAKRYLAPNYFHTSDFQNNIVNYMQNIYTFVLHKPTLEKMKADITITEEDIDNYRYQFDSIENEINEINYQYEDSIVAAKEQKDRSEYEALLKEREAKIKVVRESLTNDEYVRKVLYEEQLKTVESEFKQQNSTANEFAKEDNSYSYFLVNNASNEVFTNTKVKSLAEAKDYFNKNNVLFAQQLPITNKTDEIHLWRYLSDTYDYGFNQHYTAPDVYSDDALSNIQSMFSNYSGYIGIPKTSVVAPLIENNMDAFTLQKIIAFAVIGASIAALGFVIWLYRKSKITFYTFGRYDSYIKNMALDIRILMVLITFAIFFNQISYTGIFLQQFTNMTSSYYDGSSTYYWGGGIFPFFMQFSLLYLIFAQIKLLVDDLKDNSKNEERNQNLFTLKLLHSLQQLFFYRNIGLATVLSFALLLCAGALFGIAISQSFIDMFVFFVAGVAIFVPTCYFLISRLGYLSTIVNSSSLMVARKMDKPLKEKKRYSILNTLAHNINVANSELHFSQREQVKSERLKTELITNVSHDLRTPLTSIITYADLLKSPHLTEEERASYLDVIDKKSKRLKLLIDDLFEVSKMASGAVELNREKVNITHLVQQSLAEHDEHLRTSGLDVRITAPEHPVYVSVDGRKMWRLFDNLIVNILKYSLENTRVYITVNEVNNQAVLTFRNISRYPLGSENDELFERFKRGDTARNTEGSGLGLAIAKSIAEIHGATLDIENDGDLFKVIMKIETI